MTRTPRASGPLLAVLLLVLATPGLADEAADTAGEVLAPYGTDAQCTTLDVPGCRVWESRWMSGGYPWNPEDHWVQESLHLPGSDSLVLAGPVVESYSSPTDMKVRALDASSGAELWSFTWDGPSSRYDDVTSLLLSPDGTTLYVVGPGDYWDYADRLYVHALDAQDGHRLWTASFGTEEIGPWSRISDAILSPDGSTITVGGTGYVQDEEGDWTRQGILHALDPQDAVSLWNHTLETNWTWARYTDLATDGDGHVVALSLPELNRSQVEVLDPADGSLVANWSLSTPTPWDWPALAVREGSTDALVMIGQEDRWNATLLDLATGTEGWTSTVPAGTEAQYVYDTNPPAVAWGPGGDTVAVAGLRSLTDGGLVLLNASDGSTIWDREGDHRGFATGGYRDVTFTPDRTSIVAAGALPGDAYGELWGYGLRAGVASFAASDGEFEWSGRQCEDCDEPPDDGAYRSLHLVDDGVLVSGWLEADYDYGWLATRYAPSGDLAPCSEELDDPGSCDAAVVTTGEDAHGEVLAVSTSGNATCDGPCAAASGGGDAEGPVAVSGDGGARGNFLAVAATGPAEVCEDRDACLASASGTGDASGGRLAVSGTGDASTCYERNGRVYIGRCHAVSGTGDARADWFAMSATGNSTSEYIGVSGTGHADGGFGWEVSGCDTLAAQGVDDACWHPGAEGLLP